MLSSDLETAALLLHMPPQLQPTTLGCLKGPAIGMQTSQRPPVAIVNACNCDVSSQPVCDVSANPCQQVTTLGLGSATGPLLRHFELEGKDDADLYGMAWTEGLRWGTLFVVRKLAVGGCCKGRKSEYDLRFVQCMCVLQRRQPGANRPAPPRPAPSVCSDSMAPGGGRPVRMEVEQSSRFHDWFRVRCCISLDGVLPSHQQRALSNVAWSTPDGLG